MTEGKLPTDFAPAERSTQSELKRQVNIFSSSPVTKIFDLVPDVVLVLNCNRQIVFANKNSASLFGITQTASVLGLRPGELFDCTHAYEHTGGCGTSVFCSECGSVRATLSSLRGEEAVQECGITQKGSGDSIDLRIWTYPVTLENEDIVVYIASDISNEKRKEVLQRTFYHDITNTVGNLRGFAEILKNASHDDAEEFRETIHELAGRLMEEIKTHRDLEAAEKGELAVQIKPIDSQEILQDIQNQYKRSEIGKDRQIRITPDTHRVTFTSDRVLLTRILGNMVKNALEASSPGDAVTLSAKQYDDEVQFSVHNPAIIPPEAQLQIFQRSFSTKGPGRGIGTYSMRLLSERYLKGNITFTSSEERGTTFIARYPLKYE